MVAYYPNKCYMNFVGDSGAYIDIPANTTITDIVDKFKVISSKELKYEPKCNPLELRKVKKNGKH